MTEEIRKAKRINCIAFGLVVLLVALIVATALLLSSCGFSQQGDNLQQFCEMAGIPLREAKAASGEDSHGGFHGDGARSEILDFSGYPISGQVSANLTWTALPLSEDFVKLTDMAKGFWTVPDIQNGYYYFMDRYSPSGPGYQLDVLERHSFNYSIGFYDCDTEILYYFELDS